MLTKKRVWHVKEFNAIQLKELYQFILKVKDQSVSKFHAKRNSNFASKFQNSKKSSTYTFKTKSIT